MIRVLAASALACVAPATGAQVVGVTFDVDEPILAPGDSTTVRLLASFPDGDYAFASAVLDMLVDGADPFASISNFSLLPPMASGPTSGVRTERGIEGIIAAQLNFPPAGIYADPTNPIPFFQFTFYAHPDAGGGYRVDLSTLTSRFDVYPDRDMSAAESRLDLLVEGEASILVVPAPGVCLVLTSGLLLARRRR